MSPETCRRPDPSFRIVALASSAGGLAALSQVLAALPKDFPAPIVVVQHLDPNHPSWMAPILARRVHLRVVEAQEGETLQPGTVYIAPPNHHLLIRPPGVVELSGAAQVHHVRPSADLLFSSLAEGFGERVVAVVLTGSGSDGAAGIRRVKQEGGTVIAQDQATSEFFGMPGAALRTGDVDRVMPLAEIGDLLLELTRS